MWDKVRALDRRLIRLSDPVAAQVEYLARLAGVSTGAIVEFILTEVFESGDDESPAVPAPEAVTPPRPGRPADVIPISRKHPADPARVQDPTPLRRKADAARARASAARAHAAAAHDRAERARALALESPTGSEPPSPPDPEGETPTTP
jgi:hypothetical protein